MLLGRDTRVANVRWCRLLPSPVIWYMCMFLAPAPPLSIAHEGVRMFAARTSGAHPLALLHRASNFAPPKMMQFMRPSFHLCDPKPRRGVCEKFSINAVWLALPQDCTLTKKEPQAQNSTGRLSRRSTAVAGPATPADGPVREGGRRRLTERKRN